MLGIIIKYEAILDIQGGILRKNLNLRVNNFYDR